MIGARLGLCEATAALRSFRRLAQEMASEPSVGPDEVAGEVPLSNLGQDSRAAVAVE